MVSMTKYGLHSSLSNYFKVSCAWKTNLSAAVILLSFPRNSK